VNKLSLVGMRLPETYKENFDVSSEGPSSGVTMQALPILAQTVQYCIVSLLSMLP
jgi:hypothetical protein